MKRIQIALPKSFNDQFDEVAAQTYPSLVKTLRLLADAVVEKWTNAVKGSSAKDGWKDKYASAIESRMISSLEWEVFAESMFANFVESGIDGFDMKEGLLSGPHARKAKDGTRYNIVPFRKFTPGTSAGPSMSTKAYQAAKELDSGNASLRTRVTGIGGRVRTVRSVMGATSDSFNERVYSTGRKLGKEFGDKMRGTVKAGSAGHTHYGNFRIVSDKSKGWQYPDIKAVPIFEPMVKGIEGKVKDHMSDALERDLAAGDSEIK